MPTSQLSFSAFAAEFVCPPPAANDAAPAVTAPAVSGQGVGTIRVREPFRGISFTDVAGDVDGDWYIDWQSLGGCLDAPDCLPHGGSLGYRAGLSLYVVDGITARRD